MLTIEVSRDLSSIADVWQRLEDANPGFVYQRFGWNAAWFSTIGAALGGTPAIVTVSAGEQIALLPLAIRHQHGVRSVIYAGGSHSNANGPLGPASFPWPKTQDGVVALLKNIGTAIGAVDALSLQAQPEMFNGQPHPFLPGPRVAGANALFEGQLSADFSALAVARQSNDTRKKLRNKERRLHELGRVIYRKATNVAEAQAILAQFFEQRDERFRKQGIANPFAEPGAAEFLEKLVSDHIGTGSAGATLSALMLDDAYIAIFGGAEDRHRYSGMFTSFMDESDIGKYSPGEQLLSHIVADCCARGVAVFDLGLGEARYKRLWCDTVIPTFETHVALSAKGHVYRIQQQWLSTVKRRIKASPALFAMAKRLRSRHRAE